MKARFMIEDPENLEATLKITMPVKDWVSLRDNLSATPGIVLDFRAAITDLVGKARKVFHYEHEAE